MSKADDGAEYVDSVQILDSLESKPLGEAAGCQLGELHLPDRDCVCQPYWLDDRQISPVHQLSDLDIGDSMTDAGDYRAPRVRDDIPALPGGCSIPNGRVYLPIPATNAPQAVAAGAVEGPRGGVYVELPPSHWKPEIEPLLPLLARKDVLPILPDLIPVSTWGSNLAQLLTKPSWDALRLPVIAARGNLCQICGEKQGAMECHELWAYSLPPQDAPKSMVGVQRLMGLAALCHSCHMVFHHGLARIQGNFEAVMERLVVVNRWTRADFQSYYADMGRRYKQRCEVNWALDLSLVAGLAPLVVQGGRGRWLVDERGRRAHLRHPAKRNAGLDRDLRHALRRQQP